MNLLFESKRDDMLIPYYEVLKSKGCNISFGRFKSILLEHLTQNGGLRNLSLSSNYYLAGAARYYFNGDLTLNKDLALYYEFITNGEREANTNNGIETPENHKDEWNREVCQKLNALIKVLRDSYIDSVGTQFEQPEDFGTLPIDKLLRKYGAKIKKELGIVHPEETEKKIDRSTNVGNGYTFEIMYSHQQCKKYYEPTNPGAWCITYGQGHYNNYVNNLDIHYVIFRKDGWENVERVPQKEKWVSYGGSYKPQDDYGNSLIALLQSNHSWKPVYITSRWNHGSGDSGGVEADHAYTTEEFMRITGVSQKDLERIYQIWKQDSGSESKSIKEMNLDKKAAMLAVKEAQIRINGGENILNLLIINNTFNGSIENPRKSCFDASLKQGPNVSFLIDKGKIIFETVSFSEEALYYKTEYLNNIILFRQNSNSEYVLYDYRLHKVIKIEGIYKFKCVPDRKVQNYDFYEIKLSGKDIALVNTVTNEPLVLPNGHCWFNEIRCADNINSWSPRNRITCRGVGSSLTSMLEIVYDLSSREKYFYNIPLRRFVEIPEFDGDMSLVIAGATPQDLEPKLGGQKVGKNYFVLEYTLKGRNSGWRQYSSPYMLFDINGHEIDILGERYYSSIDYIGNDYFIVVLNSETDKGNYYSKKCHIYNVAQDRPYGIEGVNIEYSYFETCSGYNGADVDNSRITFIKKSSNDVNYRHTLYYIFDKQVGKFLKNTYDAPCFYMFEVSSKGESNGNGIVLYRTQDYNFDNWAHNFYIADVADGQSYEFDYDDNYNIPEKSKRNFKPIEYLD